MKYFLLLISIFINFNSNMAFATPRQFIFTNIGNRTITPSEIRRRIDYFTITANKIQLAKSQVGFAKYHPAIKSHISFLDIKQGSVTINALTSQFDMDNSLSTDANNVLAYNRRLLGPIPYRGDNLDITIQIVAVKATDMSSKYISLATEIGAKASVASLNQAIPFALLGANIFSALSETDGEIKHICTFNNSYSEPKTAVFVIIEDKNNRFANFDTNNPEKMKIGTSGVGGGDYTLYLYNDNKKIWEEAKGISYLILTISASTERSLADLSEINDLYFELNELVVSSAGKNRIDEKFKELEVAIRLSKDLQKSDQLRLIAEIRKEIYSINAMTDTTPTVSSPLIVPSTSSGKILDMDESGSNKKENQIDDSGIPKKSVVTTKGNDNFDFIDKNEWKEPASPAKPKAKKVIKLTSLDDLNKRIFTGVDIEKDKLSSATLMVGHPKSGH